MQFEFALKIFPLAEQEQTCGHSAVVDGFENNNGGIVLWIGRFEAEDLGFVSDVTVDRSDCCGEDEFELLFVKRVSWFTFKY